MLIATGRYLYRKVNEENKKKHFFSVISEEFHDELEVSQNQYLVWRAIKSAKKEEAWRERLAQKKFTEKNISKHLAFLKKHHLVMEIDVETMSDDELKHVMVTKNGFSLGYRKANDQYVGIIKDMSFEDQYMFPLSANAFWVYSGALSDSLYHVIERVMVYTSLNKEEAKKQVQLYLPFLNMHHLWSLEYFPSAIPAFQLEETRAKHKKISFPFSSPHRVKEPARLGVSIGAINKEGNVTFGLLEGEEPRWVSEDEYRQWLEYEPKKLSSTLREKLFSPMDEDHLYICPQGQFVKYNEETDSYILKTLNKSTEIELTAEMHLFWRLLHPCAPMSYIRKTFRKNGWTDEIIDFMFKEFLLMFCLKGLAYVVKK